MVFVVEPIKTFCDVFFFFFFYSGIVAAVSHDKHERSPPTSAPSKIMMPLTLKYKIICQIN